MSRICRKCGKLDKRGFGGASYCYPERDSMLCEKCFKETFPDTNLNNGENGGVRSRKL